MNRKFFASLLMLLIVLAGAFSPVLGLVSQSLQPTTVYADNHTGAIPQNGKAKDVEPAATELKCGTNFVCGLVNIIVYLGMFLPNLFAQVSGMVLDYVVWYNLESSTWTSQDTAESFVVKGWKITRDFSNLLFIFALFAVAFSLILNGAGTSERPLFGLDPKRTIARVILMALLINFSFFMCRSIIEISNLFGNTFYGSITETMKKNGQDPSGTQDQNQTLETSKDANSIKKQLGSTSSFYTNVAGIRSISLAVISKVNPQQLMLGTIGSEKLTGSGFFWKSYDSGVYVLLLFVAWIVGIFNFFLVYLFISSAIFLVSRVFGLYFLIILSPIAFVSTTIPSLQAKEYFGFDDWFKQLVGLAFCLPIYLFFFWLGIQFLSFGIDTTSKMGYIAAAAVIMVKLAMMGAVLIFGKKIAKDMSGKIGAMASGAVTSIVTGAAMVAGAAMTGGASAALRMGGGLAKNAAISGAGRVGEIVGGEAGREKVNQLRQWMGSGNFKSFSRLNNFNPMKDMRGKTLGGKLAQIGTNVGGALGEAARISGSEFPDKLGSAYRQGKLTPRAENIAKIREEKLKKIAAIDAQMRSLDEKMKNPNLTKAEKDALKQQKTQLAKDKWNIQNAITPNQGPVAGNGTPTNGANPQNPGATNPGTNTANPAATGTPNGAGGTTIPVPPATTQAPAAQPVRPPQNPTTPATGSSTPAATPTNQNIDTSRMNQQQSTITPEQSKQIATDIENEMRTLEKEMNEPATRQNKSRMQELESKYNNLDSERKDVASGNVAPARLKSFSGQPVIGAPSGTASQRTLGDGTAKKPDLTPAQQERVLNRLIREEAKAGQVPKPPTPTANQVTAQTTTQAPIETSVQAPAEQPPVRQSEKASSLLSGISGGTPTTRQTIEQNTEKREVIDTPIMQNNQPAEKPTGGLVNRFGAPISSQSTLRTLTTETPKPPEETTPQVNTSANSEPSEKSSTSTTQTTTVVIPEPVTGTTATESSSATNQQEDSVDGNQETEQDLAKKKLDTINDITRQSVGDVTNLVDNLSWFTNRTNSALVPAQALNQIEDAGNLIKSASAGDEINYQKLKDGLREYADGFSRIGSQDLSQEDRFLNDNRKDHGKALFENADYINEQRVKFDRNMNEMLQHVDPEHRSEISSLIDDAVYSMSRSANQLSEHADILFRR